METPWLERRYQRNPMIVTRSIAGERLLIPIHRSVGDKDWIFTLNETAGFLWDALEELRSGEELVEMARRSYEAGREELVEDVGRVLGELEAVGAVVLDGVEPDPE
ncbi:MAG: hypothetical protein CME06_15350 [Gemmatimonadetes bacterium]|nr:hypothetical protein [Gemmatimonadota bacterium]